MGAALALWGLTGSAQAAENCREITADGGTYIVCEVAQGADLRLFLNDANGATYGTFDRLSRALNASGQRLVLAMNGGMYHADRSPVGLYIEEGQELAPIVTSAGPGNFGLLPNGVFCISKDRFRVIESRAFRKSPPACRFATQSGPMLVIDGALHPRFLPDASSRYVRNGVGVSKDGKRAYLVISKGAVTFHEFGRLFRDQLGASNALYLDGSISKLYAPEIRRRDMGRSMGPILALVAPAKN